MPASGSRSPIRRSYRRGSTRSWRAFTPPSAADGRTSRAGKPGRFQLEAAIQSAHARRAVTGRTDWEAIALLYEGLLLCAATIGARVGHAAALAQARGAEAGLAAIDAIPHDSVTTYQPYWALRAHLLKSLGRAEEAGQAFARAIGPSEDRAVREFLAGQSRPAEAPRRATSRRRPSADPSRGRRDRS